MDLSVSKNTLDLLEDVMDDIILKCLHEVHETFLSDLDFSELEKIRTKMKKKKFILIKKEDEE